METIGLLVTLEARSGKEAEAEAFLKSSGDSPSMKKGPCGAPLRLLVPVKLGLKNVKAITRITYTAEKPKDYWAELGYSYYDGI